MSVHQNDERFLEIVKYFVNSYNHNLQVFCKNIVKYTVSVYEKQIPDRLLMQVSFKDKWQSTFFQSLEYSLPNMQSHQITNIYKKY